MDRQVSLHRADIFSFANPWIRYFLFFFTFLFWVFSVVIFAMGVYVRLQKAAESVRDSFLVDPALMLMVVGVMMFFITFCGCVGALRENIRLLRLFSFSLTLVFLIQMVIAVLGFFYSEQSRDALGKLVKNAIVHYRDDLDLQHLMDYIQKEFQCCGWNNYTDWSWNCSASNPSAQSCAVPFSCCGGGPAETLLDLACGFEVVTRDRGGGASVIHAAGCAEKAGDWVESHLLWAGQLALGLALPQVAGVLLSQILICEIQKETRSVL